MEHFYSYGPATNGVIIKRDNERLQLLIEIDKKELNEYLLLLGELQKSRKRVNHQPDNRVVLTKREREIAQRLLRGQTNKSIADSLYISLETVKTHRRNLFRKLGCKKITELMTYFS